MDADYRRALGFCVAVLVLKAAIIGFLRLLSSVIGKPSFSGMRGLSISQRLKVLVTGRESPEWVAYDEETSDGDEDTTDQAGSLDFWIRLHQNVLEHEPFFMVLAVVYAEIAITIQVSATVLVYVFMFCRILHMVGYVLQLKPMRSLCFAGAFLAMSGLAVLTLCEALRSNLPASPSA